MNIYWSSLASTDVVSIKNYSIDRIPSKILLKIINEIENAAELISKFPTIGKLLDDSKTRKYSLTEYKYILLYEIDTEKITIKRVLDYRNIKNTI
jgi:plasmid stabilization system protein ParE